MRSRDRLRRSIVFLGRAAATILVAMTGVVSAPSTAGAVIKSARWQVDGPVLRIETQDSWTQPGQRFATRVALREGAPAATIELSLHRPVFGRLDFAASLRGDGLGTPIWEHEPVEVRRTRSLVLVIPPEEDGSRPPGVYPVSIRVRDGSGEVLDRLITHLNQLGVDDEVFPALRVASLFDLRSDPLRTALAEPSATAEPTLSRPGELESVPSALASGFLRADPALGDAAAALASLGAAVAIDPIDLAHSTTASQAVGGLALDGLVARSRLLPETMVSLVEEDWLAVKLDGELGRQHQVADDEFAARFGRRADPTVTLVRANPGPRTRAWQQERGAIGMVTVDEGLEPLDAARFPVTLARPFRLEVGDAMPVVSIDPVLREAFVEPLPPQQLAHRLLSELAVIWAERPARMRGVIMAPPPTWVPQTEVLELLATGLTGADGLVLPVDLAAFFDQVPIARIDGSDSRAVPPLVRRVQNTESTVDPSMLFEFSESRSLIDSYSEFVGVDAPRLAPLRTAHLAAGDQRLESRQRAGVFASIRAQVQSDLDGVSLPDGQRLTLTSERAEVPLTIRKERAGPVTIRLRFSSQKLDFVEGAERVITLVDDQTQISVPVRSRASGEFPLEIVASSPDGRLVIATANVTIRSTAISNVGLALSGGALAFLLIWWARSAWTTRRARAAGHEKSSTERGYGETAVATLVDTPAEHGP